MPTIKKKFHRFSFQSEVPEKGTWAQGDTADIKLVQKHYKSRFWRALRQAALERDHYMCQECKRNGIIREIKGKRYADHIVNRNQGGKDELDNIQILCGPCHNRKTAKERKR